MNKRKNKPIQTKPNTERRIKHLNLEYPSSTSNVQSLTRNFAYQTCTKSVLELTGSQKKRIVLNPPREAKQFGIIRLSKQPNTKRTLIPELNPLITSTPHKKKSPNGLRFNATSPEFFYISSVGLSPSTRRFISKYHKHTFKFTDKPPYEKPKSSIRMTQYEKYTHTTQIVNLPGGSKRSMDDIRDDSSQRSFRRCSQKKLINDQSSNIACLPGSRINVNNLRPLMRLFTKKSNYDIFHPETEGAKPQKRLYSPSSHLITSPSTVSTMSGLKRSSSKNKSTFERLE